MPFFNFRNWYKLKILRFKDKKLKIDKFIYEKVANVKNHKYYDEVMEYVLVVFLTWIIFWFVVVCYKYGKYTILLGAGIAVTITLAQYYIEWLFRVRKKYHLK